MNIAYINKTFRGSGLELVERANAIIAEYIADGYDLTLRQLFYQFVTRGIIANKQTEYKRLGSVINDARLAGMLDWDAIVDRTREFECRSHWDSPAEILRSAANSYGIDTRRDQTDYVEVWIEKDALVGVIEHACKPLDVGYLSCRGFVSQSAMWLAAQRFIRKEAEARTFIIHLGDHDPSGIDMTRDIQDRLTLFTSQVIVERIALTMEQIEEYQPPPNPAKTTDSRYASYMAEYGEESWELDALDPRVLAELITDKVNRHTEFHKRERLIEREEKERAQIRRIAQKFNKEKGGD